MSIRNCKKMEIGTGFCRMICFAGFLFVLRKKFAKPIDKSEKVCYNKILHYNRSDYASGWVSGGDLCGEKAIVYRIYRRNPSCLLMIFPKKRPRLAPGFAVCEFILLSFWSEATRRIPLVRIPHFYYITFSGRCKYPDVNFVEWSDFFNDGQTHDAWQDRTNELRQDRRYSGNAQSHRGAEKVV